MDALSCLAPHAALLPCAAFTDADITRALHFSSSMPDTSSSPSSSSSAAFLADFCGGGAGGGFVVSAPPPTMPAITCESVLVADSARPSPAGPARRHQQQQLGLGPAGGRAGKRRSRASKRAPTTYISTDPANFRLMVQHVTGVQADPASLADGAAGILPTTTTTAPFDASSGLHMLDTFAAANPLLQAEQAAALQQQPCFPTLDSSWSAVMYDGSDLL
ncbi:calmodulin-binding protein 25 [Oryza sativa Japonica Group]|jgi:hypothetical protein|uniref:Os07g0686600 protein n=8 Tax=Oryza TaxID=4527 RepID=A0A0P0XA97_ORYSJ|nr:calmodulin-binding protein 25 [Oryza sativa Japonica Group]XP_052162825.1 calmodulin-binding protein 25-like [Oryza glaberrima]EAZ05192.1 hypothetical protein OsI_27390 [Oryza sativa Indica Group]KAB8106934.1 hypothetical protein EE612_041477 [Oryza sativa]KAF2924590.1 hypothetical protein DAI22_07g278800 [Oryza sativa Japonica Group]BAC10346.1 unknown protein [Oryza sativa Japonica Group]BAD30286.1 unknown protein [Oryza sativa Japonica Group]|eukprot:NP_001060685.1 Os07g0686600 [Oryza sativa Japonica Group]